MMLPTAAAITTRRSSLSEILGAGISSPPFLGVSLESLREPSRCPPQFQNFDPAKLPAYLCPQYLSLSLSFFLLLPVLSTKLGSCPTFNRGNKKMSSICSVSQQGTYLSRRWHSYRNQAEQVCILTG